MKNPCWVLHICKCHFNAWLLVTVTDAGDYSVLTIYMVLELMPHAHSWPCPLLQHVYSANFCMFQAGIGVKATREGHPHTFPECTVDHIPGCDLCNGWWYERCRGTADGCWLCGNVPSLKLTAIKLSKRNWRAFLSHLSARGALWRLWLYTALCYTSTRNRAFTTNLP